ncbi:MAG TPA: ABC transporter permease [Gemmatimonadaceae bacterium]|nr:ABC transporter permease [Gemmatimonadaceae bacterium]
MRTILQDLRYAVRTLGRAPAYTAVAVLTLALGIGANTAIFSVIHGVLLKDLPFTNGERVVRIKQPVALGQVDDAGFSVQEVTDLRARTRSLESIVEFHTMSFNMLRRGEPQRVQTGVVSANYFDALGVKPLLGRTFVPGEDQPGSTPVIVLGYRYWRERLGGDSTIIGKTVEMTDRLHTVIGVLPPLPAFPNENDVFMPTSSCPFRMSEAWLTRRAVRPLTVFGVSKPEVPLAAVRSDLNAMASQMHAEHAESYASARGFGLGAESLIDELSGPARQTLVLLLATSAFVLLIACANVANLTLVRLVHRRAELVVRAALGAGTGRLARQLLTESVVVAAAGALVGVGLAAALLRVLVPYAARFTPRAFEIGLDAPVLVFTLAVSVIVGLASGTLPLVSVTRDLASGLRARGDAGQAGGRRGRAERVLVVAQVAVSVVLLAAAGLSVRSMIELSRVDAGYKAEKVLSLRFTPSRERYGRPQDRIVLVDRILASMKEQQGVTSAALSAAVPLGEGGRMSHGMLIEGRAVGENDTPPQAEMQIVSGNYFSTIGVPLMKGRTFDDHDRVGTEEVTIISRSLAQRYWPNADPIGARISGDGGDSWIRIVGVASDIRDHALDRDPIDVFYLSYAQQPGGGNLLLRSTVDPTVLAKRVTTALHGIDPDLPVDNVRTLMEVKLNSLAPRRLTASLLTLFAVLALLIAATGIGGVLAFSVSQRTREFGVRLALGAQPGQVLSMVVRQGGTMVGLGLGLGAIGALGLARFMEGFVYGVPTRDPLTLGAVCLTLAAVGVVASLGPARRATSVDPVIALRNG